MHLERTFLYLTIFYIVNIHRNIFVINVTKLELNKLKHNWDKLKYNNFEFTEDQNLLPNFADEIVSNPNISEVIPASSDNDYENLSLMEYGDDDDWWSGFPPEMDMLISKWRFQEWTEDTSEEIKGFILDDSEEYYYNHYSSSNNKTMPLEDISKLVTAIQQRLYSDCVFLLHSNDPGWKILRQLIKLEKYLFDNGIRTLTYNVEHLNDESQRNICRQNSPIYTILPGDQQLIQELQIWAGPLWLTFLESSDIRMLAHLNIPFNSMFVAVRQHANVTVLTEIYHVGEGYPLRKNYLGNWSEEGGLRLLWPGIYFHRNNLHGLKISSGIIDIPYVKVEGNEITIEGYFGALWSILKRRLNFTMNLKLPEENTWGWKRDNGSWTGMIGMIQRGEVHLGAHAIFLTQARTETIDFTMPLLDFGYSLFTEKPNPYKMAWNSLISPFTYEMWWMSGASMLIIAVFLWSLELALHCLLCNRKQHKHSYTLTDILICVTGIFFQQGSELYHQSVSIRIVILTASLLAIILHAGYSATLLSFLATDADEISFNSLYDLLEIGNYKIGCLKESAEYFFLRDSKDPTLHRAFTELLSKELPNTFEEGIKMICNSSFAFLAPDEDFKPLLNNATCNIHAITHVFKMYLAIPIIKNSPYRKLFDHSIHYLRSNGVLEKLWKDYWSQETAAIEENWVSVSIKDIVLATTALLVGAVASIILILIEKSLNSLKTRRKNYKSFRRRKRFLMKKNLPMNNFRFYH